MPSSMEFNSVFGRSHWQGNTANPDSLIGPQLDSERNNGVILIWALSPFKGVKTNLKVKLAPPLFRAQLFKYERQKKMFQTKVQWCDKRCKLALTKF